MRLNFKHIAGLVALGWSIHASAGYIATGARITSVSNTAGNGPVYAVVVTGGIGPCGNSQIVFPASAASDFINGKSETHTRGYAAALMALSTGMKVDIHNYANDNCDGAAFIAIHPN